jgi:hypothetical protein
MTNAIALFRLEIWKMRGLRKGVERGNVLYVRRKRINYTYF